MYQVKQTIKVLTRICTIFFVVCCPFVAFNWALAEEPTYKSTNYGVDEVFMGAGGLNDASSDSYWARASLGDLVVGNTASDTYQAYGGFTTTADPYIALEVDAVNRDLGYLETTSASTTYGVFRVKAYLASGYVVVSGSDPPSYSSGGNTHYFDTPAAPSASSPGTEQFGINLVANTAPDSVGADPVQIPDASYSYGQVDSDYATANSYMYAKGDRIAYSDQSSGFTEYTVSYMYNISEATPAGEYVFYHVIIATATY